MPVNETLGDNDQHPMLPFTRREFLGRAVFGVTVSLAAAACAPSAPPAAKPTAAAGSAAGALPASVPLASKPTPQFLARGEQYEDGYISYPANRVQSVSGTPGNGGTISALSIGLFPPPTPFDQNPAWQAVNKALNANVQFSIVPQSEYPAKLGVTIAGGDLPDLMYFWGSSPTVAINAVAGLPQFLQSQAADLTPYLAGDAIKEYPNLAALPSFAWRNSGSIYNGHVQMVPKPSYTPGFVFLKNTTHWDKDIGRDVQPKDADDFRRMLKVLTHPQEGRWGIGSDPIDLFGVMYMSAFFGAPNNWRLEADGKLVKNFEAPEFKEAVAYLRDLWTDGVFHPNTGQYSSNVVARGEFAAGKWAVWHDAFNVGWSDAWRRARTGPATFDVHLITPFPAHDGGKPAQFMGSGTLGATSIKKGTPDRIKELLRVLNFLAAPFGSQEDLLLTFGVEGIDYTMDAQGNPVPTDRGNSDANYVPWKYLTQRPPVLYQPDIPDFAQQVSAAENILLPMGVPDPTVGYVSETAVTRGISLTNTVNDGIRDIIVGRRAVDDVDTLARDWRSAGGDQIRKELQDAIATNPGS
ncbi:MAG: extracellular solute-binding protein [Chloroflexota bacterium]